jgi:DNA-binding CsgD family transcriptional regulator
MHTPAIMSELPQSLTPREKDVLIKMLRGASDLEIADQLQIFIHTVKEHGKSIRYKYNVKTRLQLISMLLGCALNLHIRGSEPRSRIPIAIAAPTRVMEPAALAAIPKGAS